MLKRQPEVPVAAAPASASRIASAAALVVIGMITACGGGRGTQGALTVEITSDLTYPKDFDSVGVQIVRSGRLVTNELISFVSLQEALPLKFQLLEEGTPNESVSVHVTVWKAGELRIVRDAEAKIPKGVRTLLVMSLNWLCDGLVKPDAKLTDAAAAESSCAVEETCVQGSCVARRVPFEELLQPEAASPDAGQYAAACFDVRTCFEGGSVQEVVPDLRTCSFEPPANASVGLNIAIELPPADAGVCTDGRCLVPLDGFRIGEGWTSLGTRIGLPPALCVALEAGRVRKVLASSGCATKTRSVPVCVDPMKPDPGRSDAGAPTEADAAARDAADAGQRDAGAPRVDAASPPPLCPGGEPEGYGKPCGQCGGKITCRGTCSVSTPANYGASCGSCGGAVKCDGSCSVRTPANYGASCGSCGGVVKCDGSCSVMTPPDFGAGCNACRGRIACDRSCKTIAGVTGSPNSIALGQVAYLEGGAVLPPGRYRATYVDGCIRYDAAHPGWSLHASSPTASPAVGWFLVGATTGARIVWLPGSVGGNFADFEACVSASRAVPAVEFDFAGGKMGVWLFDILYTDNVVGPNGRNPTWRIDRVGDCQ